MLRRVARSSVVPSGALLVGTSTRHAGPAITAHKDPLPVRNPPVKIGKGTRAGVIKSVNPENSWSWNSLTSDRKVAVPIPEETKKQFADQMLPKRDADNSIKAANLLEKVKSEKNVKERTWMEHKKGLPTPSNPTHVPFIDPIEVQHFWESYVLPLRAQSNSNPLGYTPMTPPYCESKRPKVEAEEAAKKKEVTSS